MPGAQRDRRKAGDEHDLDAGLLLGGAARQLDAVEPGHDHIGEQQVEGHLGELGQRVQAVTDRHHLVTGPAQGLGQELAHGVVVFRQQDLRHQPMSSQNILPPGAGIAEPESDYTL